MKISKSNLWLWTATAFLAFFVFGFSDNLKGPTLPALLDDLHFDYALGGTVLLGLYIGFMVATLVTGPLADAAGKKVVLLLAGVCLVLGVSGYSTFSLPITLWMSMAVLGFGLGALELGCNALIVELHTANKGRYLNLMSVMHGMGSMAAPLFAGWLLGAGISWRAVYRWDLVLVGLFVGIALFTPYHRGARAEKQKIDLRELGKTAFAPRMLWYYAAITSYVMAEIGIASWIVEYLQQIHRQGVAESTGALSLFFGLIMAGRFVGSFMIERVGYLKSILLAALAASACIAAGLFVPALSLLLPLSGFFLSIIFPTITAAASDGEHENNNTVLGVLFTFAGFGGMLGPWLVGIVSDWLGIGVGISLNLLFGLLTAASAFVLIQISPRI